MRGFVIVGLLSEDNAGQDALPSRGEEEEREDEDRQDRSEDRRLFPLLH